MPAAHDVVTPLNIVLAVIQDNTGPKSSSLAVIRACAAPYLCEATEMATWLEFISTASATPTANRWTMKKV
jgi:hypothetical protein